MRGDFYARTAPCGRALAVCAVMYFLVARQESTKETSGGYAPQPRAASPRPVRAFVASLRYAKAALQGLAT